MHTVTNTYSSPNSIIAIVEGQDTRININLTISMPQNDITLS